MADKITAPKVRAMKAGSKVVCVTAYDAVTARIADLAGVDVLLVGDSVGNTMLGYPDTLPVSMEDMVHHTRAVASVRPRALLVADLPFGSYQASAQRAVENAVRLMKAGAEAVKLEGDYPDAIRAIVKAGIPIMGHLGMTPQSVHAFGGFRVQGRGDAGEIVQQQAKSIEEAGVFAMVLELIPAELSQRITDAVEVPTIGIGGGPGCDGQIQVIIDLLGLGEHTFRHAKAYAPGREIFTEALRAYAQEVREGTFPTEENSVR